MADERVDDVEVRDDDEVEDEVDVGEDEVDEDTEVVEDDTAVVVLEMEELVEVAGPVEEVDVVRVLVAVAAAVDVVPELDCATKLIVLVAVELIAIVLLSVAG